MFRQMPENVRRKSPLIHNITNYVTVNGCANIVLACGGYGVRMQGASGAFGTDGEWEGMKGAIFDFDGTLFDSMSIWDTAGEDYLRSLGYAPAKDLSRTLHTMSLHQAACFLKAEYHIPLEEKQIVDGINRTVEDFYFYTALPKPGVPGFLENLYQQGVKMCIATATDRRQIQAALGRCGMERYFQEIFTCTSVGHGKDEPHIFEAALRFLGTEKTQTVVFEDALHAIRTAKAAGFPVAAVYDPHEPKQEEVRALADFWLEHF